MTASRRTLRAQFEQLAVSADNEHLSASRVSDTLPHYVAKGPLGEPMLLLAAEKRANKRVPLKLVNISIDFELECALHEETGRATRGTFLRIACSPQADSLYAFFLDAMSGLVASYSTSLTAREADQLVEKALDLFKRLSEPAKSSVVGLWGELFVIQAAPDARRLVRAWRAVPTENFDFSDVGFLEVKTTISPERVHEIALEQVRPSSRRNGVVASVLAQQSSSGVSVLELAAAIAANLPSGEADKVWQVVAETLGQDVSMAGNMKLDLAFAGAQVRFIKAADVPAPELPAEGGSLITGVRFHVGLGSLVSRDVGWQGALEALFAGH